MPPVRLGPKDLLEYDATHGVIICRKCQYAIQKSALRSHLLRHKIFRHERYSLLSFISRLEVVEPEDVRLPPPTHKPIEALPVISGFRCLVRDCESLYASAKRMRRHQLESHALSESEIDGANPMVRPVSLQTFFRGTKIRYFEVEGPATSVATNSTPSVEAVNSVEIMQLSQASDTATAATACEPVVDLHHLGYLHHFLSDTSLTLPAADSKNTEALYWHHEFVAQALQQEWLMAGLLSASASHKATIPHATSTATAHHRRSVHLYEVFVRGRSSYMETRTAGHSLEALTPSYLTNERGKPTPRKEVLDQLDSVIRCAHVLFSQKTTQPGSLDALTAPIRGLAAKDDINKHDPFGRATELMEVNEMDHDPSLTTLLSRISSLPTRMVEPLARPQGPEDLQAVMTALTAIANLISSCVAGFESDEIALSAMTTWLSGTGDVFQELLAHDNPSALIVLAHWAGSLVRRVEENGCWFLKGAAEFILARIRERLPKEPAVHALVDEL